MIVLHAGFHKGRLLLWGETPAQPKAPLPRRRGQPRPHQLLYDAGAENLSSALRKVGFGFTVGKKRVEQIIAWLPTVGDQPLASSSLIAQSPTYWAAIGRRPASAPT